MEEVPVRYVQDVVAPVQVVEVGMGKLNPNRNILNPVNIQEMETLKLSDSKHIIIIPPRQTLQITGEGVPDQDLGKLCSVARLQLPPSVVVIVSPYWI